MSVDKIDVNFTNESFRTIKNVEPIRVFYDEPIIVISDAAVDYALNIMVEGINKLNE